MSETAIAAVRRFTTQGDTAANQELMHLIDHSLDVGGTSAAQTIAPQLLQWSMQESAAQASSSSTTLYVAVLNRHFCLRVVLDHLAQAVDLRPTGLIELQQLYTNALRLTVPEATRKQLTQCVACLMIVLEDRLAERLYSWIRDGDAEDSRTALHVFMAAVDLLVDRRVPLGSIRRATQRRQLQEHLYIVLQSSLQRGEDMPLLVRATGTAVHFLLEAMYGEPQEVAESFWAALPTSAVWRYCVGCLSTSTTPCPAEVLDFACDVLRCLTMIDAAAETLLLEAVPAVLQPVASPTAADWEATSRVIAAALEASTEAIITTQPPSAPLFQLFSSAAERLVQVLQAPAAPSSAVSHVCEGVSALTQVLQPTPLPEMEPTDDPEDFQEIIECMEAANATKLTALAQLRPFLAACESTLATRLARSGFAHAEWDSVAAYVSQRLLDGDAEDFQVVHEEVELALYTTYERLSRLLGPLTAEALHSIVEEPGQQLLLVAVDADLAAQWLQSVEPSALLLQAALLPCTVARYLVGTTCTPAWSADASLGVMEVLLRAVSSYKEPLLCSSSSSSSSVEAVLAVTDATVKAVSAVHDAGYDATLLRQRCAPLCNVLWCCATCESEHKLTTANRHAATGQLSSLLQRGVAALPDGATHALTTQDPYTQVVLFASGSATSSSLDTLEVLAHTLDCLAQLSEEEADAAEAEVMDGVAARVQRHCAAKEWSAVEVAEVLRMWHTRCPRLILCFLKLSASLPSSLQPSMMLEGLTRFFSLAESHDISTANLIIVLAAQYVRPVASTAATTASFCALLRWLLQPHPAITVASGGRRVRVLAACGRLLSEGGYLPVIEVTEALMMCVARWQEFSAATALSGPASTEDDDAADGDGGVEEDAQVRRAVLEDLAVWGRCVLALSELPVGAPAWLAGLRCAQDDYERVEVLKNI